MVRNHSRRVVLGVLAVVLFVTPAAAQEGSKVALVLSGGSARGFAHIGVLKVLEEVNMPIDYIVGVSMGGLIGGLYACGYTPAELESLAVSVDWVSIITQGISRRTVAIQRKRWDPRYLATMGLEGWKVKLPSGLRSGQELMMLFTRLTLPYENVEDLPIPYACLSQDLTTGEAVLLDHGNLVDAMRASMAIPWVFTPIEIDDHLLTDGGTVRNMPAQDAGEMGADIVIGVDIGPTALGKEDLKTMFAVLRQTATLKLRKETEEQYGYCDVLLVPDLEDITVADFGKAGEIIELGEQAAREILPELEALADSLNQLYGPPQRIARKTVNTANVEGMTVTGLERMSERVITADMGIDFPATVEVDKIEKGIGRIYGSGFFERVGYTLDGYPDSTTLGISVVESSKNQFRVGLRFDTRTQGSLLLNATFRNVLLHGAILALDVRLASDYQFEARHALHIGFVRSLGFQTRLNASRATIDIYEDKNQVATYRSKYMFGQIVLGSIFSSTVAIVGGIRGEYIESDPSIGSAEFPVITDKQMPITAGVLVDTWDQAIYPTRGVLLEVVAERSFAELGNTGDFSRLYLDWRSVIPIRQRAGLLLSVYIGTSRGELPFVYNYALGGIHTPWTLLGLPNSFMGLKPQQRIGPHTQAAMLGIQYEIVSQLFGQIRYNVGNTFEESKIKIESGRYINGIGLTLGVRILTGRAEVTFSTSEVEDFLTHITVGSAF